MLTLQRCMHSCLERDPTCAATRVQRSESLVGNRRSASSRRRCSFAVHPAGCAGGGCRGAVVALAAGVPALDCCCARAPDEAVDGALDATSREAADSAVTPAFRGVAVLVAVAAERETPTIDTQN